MHRTHRFGFVYVSTHKRLPRAPEGERLGRAPRCARWGSDPFVAALAGRPGGGGAVRARAAEGDIDWNTHGRAIHSKRNPSPSTLATSRRYRSMAIRAAISIAGACRSAGSAAPS